jgi:hypothetical protein
LKKLENVDIRFIKKHSFLQPTVVIKFQIKYVNMHFVFTVLDKYLINTLVVGRKIFDDYCLKTQKISVGLFDDVIL